LNGCCGKTAEMGSIARRFRFKIAAECRWSKLPIGSRLLRELPMSQTLTLPDELYVKLAKGAAERGLTIESLLAFVSDLVLLPSRPTQRDRQRSHCIERLLSKYGEGGLTAQDRAELDRLIDADYGEASARADRLIAAKKSAGASGASSQPEKSAKRPRK
jgi:hypothetical protein